MPLKGSCYSINRFLGRVKTVSTSFMKGDYMPTAHVNKDRIGKGAVTKSNFYILHDIGGRMYVYIR